MGVSWDIKESLAGDLVAEKVGGVQTRMQAVAVLQHCSLRDLSLFEFFAEFRVDGMRLIAAGGMPAAAAFSEGEFPSEDDLPPVRQGDSDPEWNYTHWRNCVMSSDRLECLRKHIAEVAASWGTECVLWHDLKRHEASLARVVEPVPTLGMVADDDSGFTDSPAESTGSLPPAVAPPSPAEQADIAAVLANPRAAVAASDTAVRKDSNGRVLASEATLAELYAAGDRIGINKVAAQAMACDKFKLRSIEDLREDIARAVIANMKSQAAAV